MDEFLEVGTEVELLRPNYGITPGTRGVIKRCDRTTVPYLVSFGGLEVWLEAKDVRPLMKPKSESAPRLKVGDRVRIKSREWYEANKNPDGYLNFTVIFVPDMVQYCGREFEITRISTTGSSSRIYNLKGLDYVFCEEMFDLEPHGSCMPSTAFLVEPLRVAASAIFGHGKPEPFTSRLPLIKKTKLLTNIKID